MLTQDTLRTLNSLDPEGRQDLRKMKSIAVRGFLEKGQLLYRFDRNRTNLDVYTFVGFIDNLEGYPTAIISQGTDTHASSMVVEVYLVRDILLSTRGEYDTECYFIEESFAKRRLKRYIKKTLEKQLAELEGEKS